MISLLAQRGVSASVSTALTLRRSYEKCWWGRTGLRDGSGAYSCGSIQVIVEFELQVDPISKLAAWL
jgi:hypothetical protein